MKLEDIDRIGLDILGQKRLLEQLLTNIRLENDKNEVSMSLNEWRSDDNLDQDTQQKGI